MVTKLLLTGPHVDRALTLLALIQTATNPVERDRYEGRLKKLRAEDPRVHEIRDDDPRIPAKVAELLEAFAQPARGFYIKCGSHWTNVMLTGDGASVLAVVSSDAANATPFDTWDEATRVKALLEARPYAGIHDVVEVR